jgi:hemolysin activation/secretion protein
MPSFRFPRLALSVAAFALGPGAPAQTTTPVTTSTAAAPAPSFGPLLGLVVLDDVAKVAEGGRPGVRGVDFTHAPALADPGLVAQLHTFLGQPLDTELLPALRRVVGTHFSDTSALLVRLILPVQDVRDGVVQVVLLRARIGAVKVEGARWFPEATYRTALGAAPGEALNPAALSTGLDRINGNGFRRATVELEPGDELGLTNVTLRAEDRIPLALSASYSDSGTASTGRDRVNASVTWGNAFGRGDTLGYSFGVSPGSDILRSHGVNYASALPWGHRLTFGASHAVLRSELPPPFNQTGRSSSLNLGYELPLPSGRDVTHQLSFAADYKRSDSNLLFSDVPVFGSLTEVLHASVDYGASWADRLGTTSAGVTLTLSPGGLTAHNTTVAFRGQRADASARYATLQLSLNRRTRLPAGFSLTNSLRLQFATDNLLGSEQLGLGGAYSNRGYEEGEVYADEGMLLRQELHAAPLQLGRQGWRAHVQALVFWDYGYGLIKRPLVDERDRYSLSSIGPGIRVSVSRHLTASLDYGWQLIETGLSARRRSERGHLTVTLAW